MKNEIEKILGQIYIPWDGSNLSGVADAADELQALMCYREVRAYVKGCGEPVVKFELEDCQNLLMKDYPETIVQEAINKFKSEQQ